MTKNLDELISKAKSLVRDGDEAAAFEYADQIVEEYPNNPKSWMLRGYLNERSGNLQSALRDAERVVALGANGPREFYTRGRYHFQLGHNTAAVEDFTTAIGLCDLLKDDYYRNALYFERAEAYLRLGKKAEALADANLIPNDSRWWTFKLRSKQDLIRDCMK